MAKDSVVRPERLELPTYWFEASRSIQLSYGRAQSFRQMRQLKPLLKYEHIVELFETVYQRTATPQARARHPRHRSGAPRR
jgi:hypothetical protein